MRSVIQRVLRAAVRVEGAVVGAIGKGALVLLCIEVGDGDSEVEVGARKLCGLRFFPGRTPMDLTLAEVGGSVLVVSQFTLAGSLVKGNRPSFTAAADPATAERLCDLYVAKLRAQGLPVATGKFAADMQVELVNDGPVTFVQDVRQGAVVGLHAET